MSALLELLASLFRRKPAPPPTPDPATPAPDPSGLVNAINRAGAQRGRPPLAADAELSRVASEGAARVASSGVLALGDSSGRIWAVHPGAAVGECLAEGQPDAGAVVAGWMFDPTHRAIVLGKFDLVGVGSGRGRDGAIYWCADFSTK